MKTLQELQAELLIVKAKAYDEMEKAKATEEAYQEALRQIAVSLGYAQNEQVTVKTMCEDIDRLYKLQSLHQTPVTLEQEVEEGV